MNPTQIQQSLDEAIRRCSQFPYPDAEWQSAYQEIQHWAPFIENEDPAKELHRMAEHSDVSLEEFILRCGPDPSQWLLEGRNLAFPAARGGQLEKLRWLVAHGVNPDARDEHGYSPLFQATHQIQGARLDIIRFLVECGVDPDATSTHRESPLRASLMWGNYNAARILMDAGADPFRENFTTLHQTAAWGSEAELACEIQKSADLEPKDTWENTPWLVAIQAGRIEAAKQLAEAAACTAALNHWENGPLHLAAVGNHPNILRELIATGHDYQSRNKSQETPLHVAVTHDSREVAEILLQAGADANSEADFGHRPIGDARNVEMVALLAQHGADINHIDRTGEWVLKEFAFTGNLAAIQWLLDHGAEVDRTSTGETALFSAVCQNHFDAVTLLLDRGANINQGDVDGDVSLRLSRSIQMAVLLMSRGANPLIEDMIGTLPENDNHCPLPVRNAIRTYREAANQPFRG